MTAVIRQLDCGAEVWGTFQYAGAEAISLYELGLAICRPAGDFGRFSRSGRHAVMGPSGATKHQTDLYKNPQYIWHQTVPLALRAAW